MDSLIEEIIKQKVLQVGVAAVTANSVNVSTTVRESHRPYLRLGDILKEDGADNATTTPHECNLGLVKLPLVFLCGLFQLSAKCCLCV